MSLSPIVIDDLLTRAEHSFGLPDNLLHAVAWVESRWSEDAVSPAGAYGLMQLMPANWPAAGGSAGSHPKTDAAIVWAGRFLARQLRHWRARWPEDDAVRLSLMSYNGGPGNVRAQLAKGRLPADVRFSPPGQRDYAGKVEDAMAARPWRALLATSGSAQAAPPRSRGGGGGVLLAALVAWGLSRVI